MARLVTWGIAICVPAAGGYLFGVLQSSLLQHWQLEYVVDLRHLLLGWLKAGVLVGSLYAAAAVVTSRPVMPLPALLRNAAVAAVAAAAVVLATAGIIYAAGRLGWYWPPDALARQVDHPNRLAVFLGIRGGGTAGAVVAAMILLVSAYRQRSRA